MARRRGQAAECMGGGSLRELKVQGRPLRVPDFAVIPLQYGVSGPMPEWTGRKWTGREWMGQAQFLRVSQKQALCA